MQIKVQFTLFLIFIYNSDAKNVIDIILSNDVHLTGSVEESYNGREFHSFRKIPFAQPPVGENRFEPPLPLESTNKVIDGTEPPPACAQGGLGINAGEEDCLYLNVFVPKLEFKDLSDKSLPVIVWFHGGSFVVGSTSYYSPHLLMDRDVILVMPQYRLGLLGFLSSGSSYALGNQGSLDQVMALQWVRDNIADFGGDPTRVTLAGDCAGGASSLYHLISPLSKGLFHRVISLSGSPLSPWARHAPHRRLVMLIANILKCPANEINVMLKCFKEVDISEILTAHQDLVEARDLMVGNDRIAPNLQDKNTAHASTFFLEEDPIKTLHDGRFPKVPVLLSVTRDVGSYLVDMVLYDFFQYNIENDPKFMNETLFQMMLKENGLADIKSKPEIKDYKNFYFPGIDFQDLEEILPGLAKMLGDTQFYAGIYAVAKYLSKQTDVKLMKFEYEGGPRLFSLRHPDPTEAPPLPKDHVGHGDELFFILPENRTKMTSEQEAVSNHFLDIIADFAYSRESKIKDWKTFTETGLDALTISPSGDVLTNQKFVSEERAKILTKTFNLQFKSYIKKIWPDDENRHDEL